LHSALLSIWQQKLTPMEVGQHSRSRITVIMESSDHRKT